VDADYGRGIGHFHGADEVTDFMVAIHADMGETWHRLSNFVIDIRGDQATARTYVHAVLMVDRNDDEARRDVFSHYEDALIRTEDGWRIHKRRVGRARVINSGPAAGRS
jgi:hypothetical protein